MDKLIFLDTETTGNNLLSDRLFQVCYFHNGEIYSEYFKPTAPISVKAQSITHVTPKMVEDKELFGDSQMKKDLIKLLETNILVAHNAVFDICMLDKEGVPVPKFICTLKVVRFLDEEMTTPEYNLQYLRYFHELEVEADAHDAKGDVLVLKALFTKLLQLMQEKYPGEDAAIAKMVEISSKPFLFRMFNFGKYKGRKIEEIAECDKKYLEWLLTQKLENEAAEEDWVFTLRHFLKVK